MIYGLMQVYMAVKMTCFGPQYSIVASSCVISPFSFVDLLSAIMKLASLTEIEATYVSLLRNPMWEKMACVGIHGTVIFFIVFVISVFIN